MKLKLYFAILFPLVISISSARESAPLPDGLEAYELTPAPTPDPATLKKGDRLAICGDSITEQKMYSALMETYLTACQPELQVEVRQYGWSGEQAGGFLKRMSNDVLRFKPTVATTCYGMNDFRYVPYQESIAAEYRENQNGIVTAFKQAGCKIILGSPGIIDTDRKADDGTQHSATTLNQSLARFRNIGVEIAGAEEVGFADVYRPMLVANQMAKAKHGPNFKVAGGDGVHPGWTGQLIMAYGFLKSLGVNGDLGSVTVDEITGNATATGGHEIVSAKNGTISMRSSRLVFAPGPGPEDNDNSIRAGMALVPFDEDLNRLTFKLTAPKAAEYEITWGNQSRKYTAAQVAAGVNLAGDFDDNPMVPAFKVLLESITKKQAYETRQIKELAHGLEGGADMEGTFAVTEKARALLVAKVLEARQPVNHTLTVRGIQN